jgi:glycosyltransferase involved in cell wall biosynthesis
MKVLALMPYLREVAPSQRFRIEQWAGILEPLGVHVEFASFESRELRRVLHTRGHYSQKLKELARCIYRRARSIAAIGAEWDVIFLHRELMLVGPPILERMLSRKGIPIVYDLDDAIFLPEVGEANRRFKWARWSQKIRTICRLSAHVIAGNQYLRDYVLKHTERVSVVPTTIDTDLYVPRESVEILGRPVIGWSGSLATLKCLRTLEPALNVLRRSVDFRLKVVGSKDFGLSGLDVESKDWSARSEVEDLCSFEIGVMPLPDDPWSRGKCGLKALQYMAVGVPTVVSPVGVNSEIIEDGKNGFIAATDEEWVEKLSLLISDRVLRERFAKNGRRTVEDRYSAKVHVPRLLEIFERVRQRGRTRSEASR